MDGHLLISGVIFGLSLGSIFFLLAVGLSLCFGLMRVISLDQLLYYSIGGYITYTVSQLTGNFWIGVLAGTFVGGVMPGSSSVTRAGSSSPSSPRRCCSTSIAASSSTGR